MPELPLKGYRVLDFCWLAAGPLVTRLLADLGADVVKVESMARLDRIREVGAQPVDKASINTNGLFNICNANKRSITVNLGTPEGIALMKEMVLEADIVSSNFTPDRMDRWGLGYADLSAIKPDVIVVSLPVMGKTGPRSGWGSYGNGIVAMGGIGALTGFPEREPVGLGTLHSDFSIPYLGALQIMAALYQREQTGKGQFIEVAQYEAATHLLDTELLDHLINGAGTVRRGNRSTEFVPHGVFPSQGEDRWVAVAARNTFEWQALCTSIGRDDLAQRADLRDLEGRRAIEDDIEEAIAAWTRQHTPAEAARILLEAGVPASPVHDVGDLIEGGYIERGHFVALPHPEVTDILVEQEPVLWDGERLPLRLAPLMGEHNEEVLQRLPGVDEERFTQLLIDGVIS